MDDRLNNEIWARLLSGNSLADLRLPLLGDRIDVRGLNAPEPGTIREFASVVGRIRELGSLAILTELEWRGLDFTGSTLPNLRIHGCRIFDCLFDSCDCSGWRVWGTAIQKTGFKNANLRQSGLGGVENGKRNEFEFVDFSNADLRQSAHGVALFRGCTFANTKLKKVGFHGSVFEDCRFSGELEETTFEQQSALSKDFQPNRMLNVDFSAARLRFVEFRGLDLDTVSLPTGADYLSVKHYTKTLDRLLARLEKKSDVRSRKLAAYLAHRRKYAGTNQMQGVFNKADLVEVAGTGAVEELQLLLSEHGD